MNRLYMNSLQRFTIYFFFIHKVPFFLKNHEDFLQMLYLFISTEMLIHLVETV